MKKLLLLVVFVLSVCLSKAQLPPTYFPSFDKTSFDFRYEPPRIDTFDYLPQNRTDFKFASYKSPANSITNKAGKQLGYFVDTGYQSFFGSFSFGFSDMNHNFVNQFSYNYTHSTQFTGSGFISFDDSSHYFYTGGSVTSGSLGAPDLFSVSFFKLYFSNNHLDSIGQMNRIINNTEKDYYITGNDTFNPVISRALFLRENNKVFFLCPAFTNRYNTNQLKKWGIMRFQIDNKLNIIEKKLFNTTIQNDFVFSLVSKSKSNRMILVINTNYKSDSLHLLQLDENNNIVLSKLLLMLVYSTTNNYDDYVGSCFSSNDSFIYVMKTDKTANGFYQDSVFQINVNTGKIFKHLISKANYFKRYPYQNKLFIAPNGKIYIRSRTGEDSINPYHYQVIDQPNREYPNCNIRMSVYASNFFDSVAQNKGWGGGIDKAINTAPVNPFYVYAEPKNRDCKGINFANLSDTIFKKFTWYWGDGDSSVTKDTQLVVNHHYKTRGKYYLKVKGELPTGYWAWYSDSITYLLANFYTKDSLGCQWVAQTFYDSSFVNANFNSDGTMWKWYFGDGDSAISYIPFISHVYKKSGVYNVTMKVDYGYCSDIISKQSVINILPAPKPGFTLDKKYACLPPNPTFTVSDTLSQLVSKKTYRFADGLADSVINPLVHNISYTYNSTGSKRIVQTLYSPSGCVSEYTDYVNLYDNQSLIKPSLPIVNINNNDVVEVFWNRLPNTQSYNVLKGENHSALAYFTNTSDTFIVDPSAKNIHSTTYQYAIQAKDRCGNFSNSGYDETSILLEGRNKHNVYSLLLWNKNNATNYPFNYDIMRWQKDYYSSINTIKTNLYEDYDYYSDSSINTCYRVSTVQQDGFKVQSNKICLGYEPYAIIPTYYDVLQYENGVPILTFYLKDFSIEIFDMLGRKVYQGNNINYWYGNNENTQYFIYRITGTSKDNNPFNQIGKILVVK